MGPVLKNASRYKKERKGFGVWPLCLCTYHLAPPPICFGIADVPSTKKGFYYTKLRNFSKLRGDSFPRISLEIISGGLWILCGLPLMGDGGVAVGMGVPTAVRSKLYLASFAFGPLLLHFT